MDSGDRSPLQSVTRIGRNSSVNHSIGLSSKRNIYNNSSAAKTNFDYNGKIIEQIGEEESIYNGYNQMSEEEQREHRMLEMINKVQMF